MIEHVTASGLEAFILWMQNEAIGSMKREDRGKSKISCDDCIVREFGFKFLKKALIS